MSQERGLDFEQWKIFSKNYEPITVGYDLFKKLPSINLSSILFKIRKGILPPLTNYVF